MSITKLFSNKISKRFLRISILTVMLVGILFSAIQVTPALAAAPGIGEVVEGVSVPGAALGSTRAQMEAGYGEPSFCQNVENIGDQGSCSFDVEGGGQVTARYRGADGGPASNSPDDVVTHLRWSQQVSGWTTTAGINTTLALADPQAVIAAYPNATVIYNPLFGNIESIEDKDLGILIDYHFDYLSGTVTVSMGIAFPFTPPPVSEKFVRVTAIDLSIRKRVITANVYVQDDLGNNLPGVTVFATWELPDGSMRSYYGITGGSGMVQFELKKARRGSYSLSIDEVDLFGYTFDRDGSVLSATITK
jgi:hypothetical protein